MKKWPQCTDYSRGKRSGRFGEGRPAPLAAWLCRGPNSRRVREEAVPVRYKRYDIRWRATLDRYRLALKVSQLRHES
jgi:hypothetical protein